MYHDSPGRCRRQIALRLLCAAIAASLALYAAWWLSQEIQRDMDAQGAASLKTAVLNAAVQCYALEGAYPSGLDTLEKQYGVQINHKKYIVTYEAFASNLLPEVTVLKK